MCVCVCLCASLVLQSCLNIDCCSPSNQERSETEAENLTGRGKLEVKGNLWQINGIAFRK